MATRLTLLTLYTLLMILLVIWIPYSIFGKPIWFLTPLIISGMLGIAWVLYTNIKFLHLNNHLIIEQPFRRARAFNLEKLQSWYETKYNIRGQYRKTLVLFITGTDRIILSNAIYKYEFEKLHEHLCEQYLLLKK